MRILTWTRIDPDGPGLHEPKLEGDIGWDLEACEDFLLWPNQQVDIPTNVRVQLPDDCWGEIRARSSISRRGLQVDSGTIDTYYTGPLYVLVRNMNKSSNDNSNGSDFMGRVQIKAGERIAQLVLHHAIRAKSLERSFGNDPRRGLAGFGSTGV